MDVLTLHELVSKFRRLFMELFSTTMDPFISSTGLPSLTANLYRSDFMAENSIQLIGDNNTLEKRGQTSQIADKYVSYLSKSLANLGKIHD